MNVFLLIAAIVVGTWNGNWFPSGRAEHRAHPDVEAATVRATGKMLTEGIRKLDPLGTNDVILVLNEIRNAETAKELLAFLPRGITLASCSAYRRRDRFDQQQDVILSTLPCTHADWSVWPQHGRETPPRGFAHATLTTRTGRTIDVYATHLKSNYGATTDEIRALNRMKRTHAIDFLRRTTARLPLLIVAGDFNADKWRREFTDETIFRTFAAAGFLDILETLPAEARFTHPNRRHGDSALDYIMVKGLEASAPPITVPNAGLSDHLALFTLLAEP